MPMTDTKEIAEAILQSFIAYRQFFERITNGAKVRFEMASWEGVQKAATERIDLYESMCQNSAESLRQKYGELLDKPQIWVLVKQHFIELLDQRSDFELAETYYNSIYCRISFHERLDNAQMFIRSSMEGRVDYSGEPVFRSYHLAEGMMAMLGRILDDCNFEIPWENKRRDLLHLARYVRENIPADVIADKNTRVEVVKSIFYRNKGAYIVGRVHFYDKQVPFVIPVLNNDQGAVYVDTAISDENDVSTIFSFTRAYFMADVKVPSEFISFMRSILPMKSVAELYSSVGFYKQGKAEFYRTFIDHLSATTEQFEIAPGIKGMVMMVFTLPGYPVVFKIIKDRFSSSKHITRQTVIDRYQLVKRHDRVGRMADTQEFTNFRFPKARFSDELLSELLAVASKTVTIEKDEVLIKHLWTERRMIPLNIYINEMLQKKDDEKLFHAINEFGKCIKQLAAANIFAGDMLFKNFGVTRHGRVVFYDYDEIMYLTDCNFRKVPEPLYPEQELSAEPWYSIGATDVFPEEFTILTACHHKVRKLFNELHKDLLDVDYWMQVQERVKSGHVLDVFPYRKLKRFSR